MRKLIFVIVLSLLLILTASAFKADPNIFLKAKNTAFHRLVTPPLYVEGANIFYCTAVNLHSEPIEVNIKVFIQDGTNTCGVGPRLLGPGEAQVQMCNSDIHYDFQPIRYCEFTYSGKSGLVLGTAQFDVPASATSGVGPAVVAVEVP